MHKREYRNIFQNEDNHFYYSSLHALVASILKREKVRPGSKILDAGCGTGGLLKRLTKSYDSVGVDISREAKHYCDRRGVKMKVAGLEKLPFKKNTFDAVVSLDVICHTFIKDDLDAIKEIVRVLKPGGVLVVRVPAFKFLKNHHDKVVMSNRRYVVSDLKRLADGSGVEIEQVSYINPSLFLGSLIFSKTGSGSSIRSAGSIGNALASFVLKAENFLVTLGLSLPIGQGVFMVARKFER